MLHSAANYARQWIVENGEWDLTQCDRRHSNGQEASEKRAQSV